ncbi:hypothetical protein BUALT_Bualt17G0044800 [Buddleja alternifolia]|uniref:No apical meristem-associated C-terminal domain-containing protein n=1 Tax=Buddleja alternifolia TaxID=168488 RepID=A0AAV6W7N4_9LAMI|nr:hypothetical protein BUALT_Bualt17G0044800 [Buddleja alternifolia]
MPSPQGLDTIDLTNEQSDVVTEKRQIWRTEDEKLMISAFLTISNDSVVGTDQQGQTFWKRVAKYYNEHRLSRPERKAGPMKTHYHKVIAKVNLFIGILATQVKKRQSGASDDQIIQEARELYKIANKNLEFKFDHVWKMVKDEPKWSMQQGSEESSKKKKTRINEEGDYTSSNPSTPSFQSEDVNEAERRPIGQKAAKKKGRVKLLNPQQKLVVMGRRVLGRRGSWNADVAVQEPLLGFHHCGCSKFLSSFRLSFRGIARLSSTQLQVSKYFHAILAAILKLHNLLLDSPVPIGDDCTNQRWKSFKGYLGALDGTYIKVKVKESEKGRSRTRKGDIAVTALVVCDVNQNFIYL